MTTIYKKGMRVRSSAEGRKQQVMRNPNQSGVVATNPQTQSMICIKWDENKQPTRVHRDFIELDSRR